MIDRAIADDAVRRYGNNPGRVTHLTDYSPGYRPLRACCGTFLNDRHIEVQPGDRPTCVLCADAFDEDNETARLLGLR